MGPSVQSIKRVESYDEGCQMLPAYPGTYVLLLRLPAGRRLTIGRNLESDLEQGYYMYVGSALSGLRRRLRRYLIGPGRQHWHIDYLLRAAQPSEIWYRVGAERLECVWADRLAQCRDLKPSIPRFGASDCRCSTHLFYAAERPSPDMLRDSAVQAFHITEEDSTTDL